jgi:DNA-binding NarL/FixJ family response regulator
VRHRGSTLSPVSVRDPVTVVVARFEDLVSRGLRAFLEEDPSLALVARDVEHDRLPVVLSAHRPRVALVNFGSLDSALELQRLAAGFPDTRLVVLASRPSPQECNQMLAFGATACLSKDTQARDILNAVHLASRGLHVLPGHRDTLSLEPLGPELLTAREAEVLAPLQAGRSNAEIALALDVGVETVRTHARNIYRKLGVASRRELAALGRR